MQIPVLDVQPTVTSHFTWNGHKIDLQQLKAIDQTLRKISELAIVVANTLNKQY